MLMRAASQLMSHNTNTAMSPKANSVDHLHSCNIASAMELSSRSGNSKGTGTCIKVTVMIVAMNVRGKQYLAPPVRAFASNIARLTSASAAYLQQTDRGPHHLLPSRHRERARCLEEKDISSPALLFLDVRRQP